MSKVGQNIANRSLSFTVTDIPYDKLDEYRTKNITINIKNSFILSAPHDDNGDDINGKTSLWITDNEGYLLNITKPTQE